MLAVRGAPASSSGEGSGLRTRRTEGLDPAVMMTEQDVTIGSGAWLAGCKERLPRQNHLTFMGKGREQL